MEVRKGNQCLWTLVIYFSHSPRTCPATSHNVRWDFPSPGRLKEKSCSGCHFWTSVWRCSQMEIAGLEDIFFILTNTSKSVGTKSGPYVGGRRPEVASGSGNFLLRQGLGNLIVRYGKCFSKFGDCEKKKRKNVYFSYLHLPIIHQKRKGKLSDLPS